jgi:hypothetical protein
VPVSTGPLTARRILVYGVTGSGKSTAAGQIAARTGLPLTLVRAIDKKPICNGNTESLRNLCSRDSIVGWHFRSFDRKRSRMRQWADAAEGPPVLVFRRAKDLERWMHRLDRCGTPG